MANQPPRIPGEDPLLAEARRLQKRASDIAGDTTGKRRAMPPANEPGATDDALLRQAREASAAAEHMGKTMRRLARQAPGGEAAKQARDVLQALHHATQAGYWIYRNILAPTAHVLKPLAGPAWRGAKWAWDRAAYTKNDEGEREFSKTRAGLLVTAVLLLIFTGAGSALVHSGLQCVWWLTTRYTDTIYLNQSEEPSPHMHSVKGCHDLPCTDQNSVYFRVEDSWFHDIRSLIVHHDLFYPDFVAGAVPPGVNKCKITAYGVRWKLFTRFLEIYPRLLEVECQSAAIPQSVRQREVPAR
jgi:hypothetical protein